MMDKSNKQFQGLTFAGEEMTLHFSDGRRVTVPLWWYPRLCRATKEQRQAWVLSAGGRGLHWEAIDEDLSIAGILNGEKALEAQAPFFPDLAHPAHRPAPRWFLKRQTVEQGSGEGANSENPPGDDLAGGAVL